MKTRRFSFFQAVCLVAGSGIGGGVMAVPYLAEQTGMATAALVIAVAYAVTLILHIMVAELSLRTERTSELLSVFQKHLFRGNKKIAYFFYALMTVILCANLAAYITGAGDILAALFPIPTVLGGIIFFLAAASLVFFGLKIVAAGEVPAVLIMLFIIAILGVLSVIQPQSASLSFPAPQLSPVLATYGMVMFSLSSLFSVPQAVAGMENPEKKIVPAVALGLLINVLITFTVCLLALQYSAEVTEVAIIGWSRTLGPIVNVLGSAFIVLAMLSTFWSISLQLSDMTRELFKVSGKIAWLIATLPSFALALLPITGFLELMRLAGGAVAVVVALLVVPAYRNAILPQNDVFLLGRAAKSVPLAGFIIVFYILMTIGSFI